MKIKIIRSKFIESLKPLQNIVANKGSLQILQNVMIEALDGKIKMTTTDLDISIISICECDVIDSGSTTLPVKLLFNAIGKVAEGEIIIDVDSNDYCVISAGNAKFKLVGMPSSEFPKLPYDENSYIYTLPQVVFKEMLKKVSYAASIEDTRRTLKGVLVSLKDSKITMVATDGRRLALVENEIEFPKNNERDLVLPSKTVQELQRSLNSSGDISLMIQKSQICFKVENMMIYSKLIEDVYPNYRQVIPTECIEKIKIDRQLLLDALDRASVMTVDEAHSIKLIFSNGKLIVTSAVSDIGEARDEVPIKYAGEKIEIMFNPSYVMDPLKVIDDDEVLVHINDGHSPVMIKCSIPFIYVLMPLRIS